MWYYLKLIRLFHVHFPIWLQILWNFLFCLEFLKRIYFTWIFLLSFGVKDLIEFAFMSGKGTSMESLIVSVVYAETTSCIECDILILKLWFDANEVVCLYVCLWKKVSERVKVFLKAIQNRKGIPTNRIYWSLVEELFIVNNNLLDELLWYRRHIVGGRTCEREVQRRMRWDRVSRLALGIFGWERYSKGNIAWNAILAGSFSRADDQRE